MVDSHEKVERRIICEERKRETKPSSSGKALSIKRKEIDGSEQRARRIPGLLQDNRKKKRIRGYCRHTC